MKISIDAFRNLISVNRDRNEQTDTLSAWQKQIEALQRASAERGIRVTEQSKTAVQTEAVNTGIHRAKEKESLARQ